MKHFFVTVFLITGLLSFAQKTEYTTQENIKYYPESFYKNNTHATERCLLDIYYPKNTKGFATIVWFHGGGLTQGHKEIPAELKDKGYCIIGVGYRLSPNVKAVNCIEDSAAAIAWIYTNISKYGGDASKLFITGHSAGGYLALMSVLDKKYLSKYSIDANNIAGIIPFSGQCITHFTARQEMGMKDTQPFVDAMAPLYHVRPDAPPLLLITGDREMEMLGRYEENAYMERAMKLTGHKNTRLFELDGYGHNMAYPAYPLLLNEVKRILEKK